MKLRHWQGYGCITAKKISEKQINDHTMLLTIELKGNHERGLYRNDTYDIFNWLLNKGKRFATKCESYRDIGRIKIEEDTIIENGESIDRAIYQIYYAIH